MTDAPGAVTTLASLELDERRLVGGRSGGGVVELDGPAPGDGVSVALGADSGDVACPPSVTVPAGESRAGFSFATSIVASHEQVTITGSCGGVDREAQLVLVPAVALAGFELEAGSVVGGNRVQGTVTRSGPAPAGGAPLQLVSTSPAASPPAAATVPEGQTSVVVTVETGGAAAPADVQLFATYGDSSRRALLTVTPAALTTLTLGADRVIGGKTVPITVGLNGAAPSAGLPVTVVSDDASVSVPAVVVAAGAASASVHADTSGVAEERAVTLTAGPLSAALTVEPASLGLVLGPSDPTAGPSVQATVVLDGAAPPGGAAVQLASTGGHLAATVASLPAGLSVLEVPMTVQAVSARTVDTITASYRGVSTQAAVTLDPPLASVTFDPPGMFVLDGPIPPLVATVALAGVAPDGGAVVALGSTVQGSLISGLSISVPQNATIPAGATSVAVPIATSCSGGAVGCALTVEAQYEQSLASGTATIEIAWSQ